MHYLSIITGFLPLLACGQNIILSNANGWAESNIRALYDKLTSDGYRVLLSAPAQDMSGTGSSDAPATVVDHGCQFGSCPPGSPAVNHSSTDESIWYVNSYPVAAMAYGIESIGPQYFDMSMDLAITGPNVGSNLGSEVLTSGSVGAATRAALLGVPAVSFSAMEGKVIPWTTNMSGVTDYATRYSYMAEHVTHRLLATSKPYLPKNTWLNVNFGALHLEYCNTVPANLHYVLTRINNPDANTPPDVLICDSPRLHTEAEIIRNKEYVPMCPISISVGRADTKADASAEDQAAVAEKLGNLLTCPYVTRSANDGPAVTTPSMVLHYSLLLVGIHWVWTTYV